MKEPIAYVNRRMPVQHYTEEEDPWVCVVLAHQCLTVTTNALHNEFLYRIHNSLPPGLTLIQPNKDHTLTPSLAKTNSTSHLILSNPNCSFHSGFVTKFTRNLPRLAYHMYILTRKKILQLLWIEPCSFSPYTSPYNDSAGCSCVLYFKSLVVKLRGIFQFPHTQIKKQFPTLSLTCHHEYSKCVAIEVPENCHLDVHKYKISRYQSLYKLIFRKWQNSKLTKTYDSWQLGVSIFLKRERIWNFPLLWPPNYTEKKSLLAIQHRLQAISPVLAKSISICSTYCNASR